MSHRLLAWYENARRDLPWRRLRDPYAIWVSEVMLQQTRVETVIPYYERFLARFPSIDRLADAAEDEVLALWSGLGYYRRARALHAGARAVRERHAGSFPRDRKSALALPGVGPYTAAAVLSIAHGEPWAVVDGNVERVVTRLLRLAESCRTASARREIEARLADWLDPEHAGDFNQAIMELGATVCRPTSPRCEACPLESLCEARAHGDQESYPRLPPKRQTVRVELEAAVLRQDGRFLIERSPDAELLPGLWLFPFRSTPGSGTPGAAVARALESALSTRVRVTRRLASVSHSVTFRRIRLTPFLVESPRVDLDEHENLRWSDARELREGLGVSSLAWKILSRVPDGADRRTS